MRYLYEAHNTDDIQSQTKHELNSLDTADEVDNATNLSTRKKANTSPKYGDYPTYLGIFDFILEEESYNVRLHRHISNKRVHYNGFDFDISDYDKITTRVSVNFDQTDRRWTVKVAEPDKENNDLSYSIVDTGKGLGNLLDCLVNHHYIGQATNKATRKHFPRMLESLTNFAEEFAVYNDLWDAEAAQGRRFSVIMIVDDKEYTYGTYDSQHKANEIAMHVRDERDVETYVKEV